MITIVGMLLSAKNCTKPT